MAIPVLLTVGALTVGFVALSKKRAAMPGGSISAPPEAGDDAAVGGAGMEAASDSAGATPLGENGPAFSSGGRALTEANLTPHAFVINTNATSGPDLSTQGTAPVTSPNNKVLEAVASTSSTPVRYTAIKFGSTSGITRVQQAAALSEIGALTGEVW